jgi:hypothetical protein
MTRRHHTTGARAQGVLGSDPNPGDRSRTSYNSQSCSVFKHPAKKDLYIALAGRWIHDLPGLEGPRFATGEAYAEVAKVYEREFDPDDTERRDVCGCWTGWPRAIVARLPGEMLTGLAWDGGALWYADRRQQDLKRLQLPPEP